MGQQIYWCMDCDGSGQDGDAGHNWEHVDCPSCDGTGNNLMCQDCADSRAACDDLCVACYVDFLKANPEEYEPAEAVWSKPHWTDVAKRFEASAEWQAHCDKALELYEELASQVAA